jgi:hypothetical protein
VDEKVSGKHTKKKRRARPREYSDEERAAGFDFPDPKVLTPEQSKQPRDATPKKKWIDPPSSWSKERLREMYEEQKRRETEEQHPVSLSRTAKKVMGRAVMGVVVMEPASAKSAVASQPKLTEEEIRFLRGDALPPGARKEIRQSAFRKFGDWRSVSTGTIIAIAQKDAEFVTRAKPFPSNTTFERALRRKKH